MPHQLKHKKQVITQLILRLASTQPKLMHCRTSHYLQCGSENTSEANADSDASLSTSGHLKGQLSLRPQSTGGIIKN